MRARTVAAVASVPSLRTFRLNQRDAWLALHKADAVRRASHTLFASMLGLAAKTTEDAEKEREGNALLSKSWGGSALAASELAEAAKRARNALGRLGCAGLETLRMANQLAEARQQVPAGEGEEEHEDVESASVIESESEEDEEGEGVGRR